MIYIGALISIQFIALTAYWLFKKYHAQAVLLFSGLAMLTLALLLGFDIPELKNATGLKEFDLFKVIQEIFSDKGAGVGLMIMTIGGFVAYMKHIKASDALVYVSMQPLSIFRKYPYLAASLVIPIGQLLFICTPSATGLGLLLVASIYPVLVSLGVSKLSAVSVISACTVFDMGPASANTARASELVGMNNVMYFIEHQMPLTIPMTILLMIVYYFSNRYYDKKDAVNKPVEETKREDFKVDPPGITADPVDRILEIHSTVQFLGGTRHDNGHAHVVLYRHHIRINPPTRHQESIRFDQNLLGRHGKSIRYRDHPDRGG